MCFSEYELNQQSGIPAMKVRQTTEHPNQCKADYALRKESVRANESDALCSLQVLCLDQPCAGTSPCITRPNSLDPWAGDQKARFLTTHRLPGEELNLPPLQPQRTQHPERRLWIKQPQQEMAITNECRVLKLRNTQNCRYPQGWPM